MQRFAPSRLVTAGALSGLVASVLVASAAQTAPKPAVTEQQKIHFWQSAFRKNQNDLREIFQLNLAARNRKESLYAAKAADAVFNTPRLSFSTRNSTRETHKKMAYAFALFNAYDLHSENVYSTRKFYESKTLLDWTLRNRSYAILYVREVTQLQDASAEVLLIAARIGFANSIGNIPDSRGPTLSFIAMARRAALKEPRWSNAHFSVGQMLTSFNMNHSTPRQKTYALEAMQHLYTAQKLSPSLKPACLRELVTACRQADRPVEALQAVNDYSKLRPAWGRQKWVQNLRVSLRQQAERRR